MHPIPFGTRLGPSTTLAACTHGLLQALWRLKDPTIGKIDTRRLEEPPSRTRAGSASVAFLADPLNVHRNRADYED